MYSVFFTYMLKDTLKRVSYYLCGIILVAILFFSKFNNKNEQLTFQRVALCLIQYKMLHFTSVTIFFFLIFYPSSFLVVSLHHRECFKFINHLQNHKNYCCAVIYKYFDEANKRTRH